MSDDTTANDRGPRDPTYSGVFENISVNSTLFPPEGQLGPDGEPLAKLSAKDARDLLLDRMYKLFPGRANAALVDKMNTEIVRFLPAAAMYPSVMNSLDLRPFFDAMLASPPDDPRDVKSLQEARTNLDEEIRQVVQSTAANTATPQSDIDAMAAKALDYTPGVVGGLPQINVVQNDMALDQAVASGQMTQEEANAILLDDPLGNGGDVTADRVVFPEEALRQAARVGDINTLTDFSNTESSINNDLGTQGYVPINVGPGPRTLPVVGEVRPDAAMQRDRVLNALDARDYLFSMRPSEVQALQQNLSNAGYLNGTDQMFTPGEADDLTFAGWSQLIMESIQTSKSIPMLLEEGTAKEGERRRLAAQQLKFQDVSEAANMLARDAIGRDLDGQELLQVRAFISNMMGERAQAQPGFDPRPWIGNDLAMAPGLTEQDFNSAIDSVVGDEQAVNEAVYSYGNANKAFGGTNNLLPWLTEQHKAKANDAGGN